MPQLFFNGQLVGGWDDLNKLEEEGKLEAMLKEALSAPEVDFPPPLKKPSGEEFLQASLAYSGRGACAHLIKAYFVYTLHAECGDQLYTHNCAN